MNALTDFSNHPLRAGTAFWLQRSRDMLSRASPVADLAIRGWAAHAFFNSGLTKIQSFDTTLLLFEEEYQVPLLPPELAAYVGTFVELAFPLLLMLGLGARFAAAVLFLFNIVAVVSYPALMSAGMQQHAVWGLLLFVTLTHGPGALSIDHWLGRRFAAREV